MAAPKNLQFAVTANRLDDGAVVYLTSSRDWSRDLAQAETTSDPASRDALIAFARSQPHLVCGAYPLELTRDASGVHLLSARERLRALGAEAVRRRLGVPV